MLQVAFMDVEDTGIDLVLSFALTTEGDGIRSLILMRTPRYEPFLDESERGVQVSMEGEFDEDPMMLRTLSVFDKSVTIKTDRGVYDLDLRHVDHEDISVMKELIAKMNFDHRFHVEES